ncbi:DUF2270 domain-containing protein [Haloarcula salinisoli]|uniref:DUF2270 domain-containing protein n=1 Tax=Haloarcula salinisoli TaxID=2487746 RepID=A0A8J7YA47_9EURY|nr:DUF2270 domain-containing protein [Halomicroarcula salinisoli]MBX0286247.1 DUF2270 domain-containing protein [Halomicroarcula salinisoli]MBX0302265.1 DUF2270 domain-containing protein [Halomicroarcula salinisoli]
MVDEPPDESDQASEPRLGSEITGQSTEMVSILGDAYRGELDRETTWRSRLDQTTTWGVTVVAAILTWAFSSGDNPHYIIIVGMLAVSLFLSIEARRYRDYDIYRSRVRLFQQNLLADALEPSEGLKHEDWRGKLSRDYRTPTLKVSISEALANRLRRIYLPLLAVLLVAWLFRITAFAPNEEPLTTAAIAAVPGVVVVALIALYYITAIVIVLWPRDREAKGEFEEGDPEEWK